MLLLLLQHPFARFRFRALVNQEKHKWKESTTIHHVIPVHHFAPLLHSNRANKEISTVLLDFYAQILWTHFAVHSFLCEIKRTPKCTR